MGIIDLLFMPASIVFAIMSAVADKKRSDIFVVLSFVFCTVPPLGAVFDIYERAVRGDIAGIQDIYPVMGVIFTVVFIMVTLINAISVIKKEDS